MQQNIYKLHVLFFACLCGTDLLALIVVSVGSLHSLNLPPCRNCELVSSSSSSSSHQQHFGVGGWTTTTTSSSLGLLKLLQERGISASPRPNHHLPKPSFPTDRGGGSSAGREGRSAFSLNLVGKLQRLGLHRVAAWGMMGRERGK